MSGVHKSKSNSYRSSKVPKYFHLLDALVKHNQTNEDGTIQSM